MRVDRIYRYPIKGFSAEALEDVELVAGEMLPHDREFALAQGDAPFDPTAPAWLHKRHFACLMANARIALVHTSFDARAGRIAIHRPDGPSIDESVLTEEGRAALGAALTASLGGEARGTPRLVRANHHRFSDSPEKLVSLINQASIGALETAMRMALAPLRFRANIYFSGAPAWSEFDWIGRQLEIGGATLEVVARIDRCAATTVNPETAARDAQVPRALRQHFGHIDMGVFARVLAGGRVATGDPVVLRMAEDTGDG